MLNTLLTGISNSLSNILHATNLTRLFHRDSRVRLVFYHGIGNGIAPCLAYLKDEISIDTFEKHIDYLQKYYYICPLEEAIQVFCEQENKYTKPVCSISFDDGLSSVFTKAFPLLRERRLTASVFLSTSVIDNKNMLWLHLLNYLIYHHGMTIVTEIISETLDNKYPIIHSDERQFMGWCKNNFHILIQAKAIQRLVDFLKVDVQSIAQNEKLYLNTEEIEHMSLYGFTFYSHTANHLLLNALNDEELQKEINDAIKYLKSKQIGSKKFVSFPFGMLKDYGARAREYALSAGHEYVLEVGDGFNSLARVIAKKTFSRVSLGSCSAKPKEIFSALEIRPRLKAGIYSIESYFNNYR